LASTHTHELIPSPTFDQLDFSLLSNLRSVSLLHQIHLNLRFADTFRFDTISGVTNAAEECQSRGGRRLQLPEMKSGPGERNLDRKKLKWLSTFRDKQNTNLFARNPIDIHNLVANSQTAVFSQAPSLLDASDFNSQKSTRTIGVWDGGDLQKRRNPENEKQFGREGERTSSPIGWSCVSAESSTR
jgi:hypothetical protein